MATLVTPAEVRQILEVPGDVTDASLQVFINTADLIVTEDLAAKGLSAARLKNIEMFLAAHFALMLTERGGLTQSRIERSQDSYTNLSPMGSDISGLALTRYGQQALILDSSGTLRGMSNNKLYAQFRVIGPEYINPLTSE